MADQPTTPSGSRWEPSDDDPAEDLTEADQADEADEAPSHDPAGVVPAPPLDEPAAEERRAQLRGRAFLVGTATALTLGGGLAGFVIGHSTAGDGHDGFRPAGFGGPPGSGRFGDRDQRQGQQQDQQQGPPGFRGPDSGTNGSDSEDDPT